MIEFATRVDDGHVWHESLDGQPLKIQANAKFAHRLDWWEHCTFCTDIFGAVLLAWARTNYPLADAEPDPLGWMVAAA